ncbi:MAG: alanine racemase [Microvirga sp.]
MSAPPRSIADWNAGLVGRAGSRTRLETPAAVLDLDLFEANLARLHGRCGAAGIAVRPHAKSHKCAEIGRRQMQAGAVGLCCAKPGELLALWQAGIPDLMLTAPVASARKIDALAATAAAGARLQVVVDRPDLVEDYAAAARRHATTIGMLVDLDVGLLRSGVASPADAVALARIIASTPGLAYRGVQAYQGRVQHIEGYAARSAATQVLNATLLAFLDALAAAGLPARTISGGGTGSHALDAEAGLFTELQPGSYVFMDEGYASVDVDGAGAEAFGPALRVAVTIVGHSSTGFAITDAGSKSIAVDGPPPRVFAGSRLVGRIEWCGDEFGRVLPEPGAATLPIGSVVECTAPHCDPTINLHETLHAVRGDTLVALWPVEARGRAD